MARRKKSDKAGTNTTDSAAVEPEAETRPLTDTSEHDAAAPDKPLPEMDTAETPVSPETDGEVPTNGQGGPVADEIWPEEPTLTGGEPPTHEAGAAVGPVDDGLTAGAGEGDPTLVTDEVSGSVSADALDDERLISVVESLLFASDRPMSLADLKRLLGMRSGKRVEAAVEALTEKRASTGVHVVAASGGWQMRTSLENAPWVSKLLSGKPMRLSRAMLETLAIVAYRQPITRPEIDEIRGVDCGPVLKTLLERGLIRIIGKKEEVGRPMLYGTTPEFLNTFSLRDLTELPTLREFHELSAEEQARVDGKLGKRGGDEPVVETQAPSGPFAPHAPLTPDPSEDDALLSELEQAAQAAARAQSAGAEPAAGTEPNVGS